MCRVVGALAVTVPGTYLILNGGKDSLGNPLVYPLPGAQHHGHHDDEEHEEEEEEEEAPAEEEESTSEDEEETPATSDEEDSSDGDSGKTEEVDEETGNKTIKYDDAKGGVKRRVESSNAQKLGEKDSSESETDEDKVCYHPLLPLPIVVWDCCACSLRTRCFDLVTSRASHCLVLLMTIAALPLYIFPHALIGPYTNSNFQKGSPSKTPVEGKTSGKQAGLSNTDTKHSTDIENDPDKSTKGDGTPETAKAQGTVQPSQPVK